MVELISFTCLWAAAPDDTLNRPDLLSSIESAANRRSSVRSQMHLSQPGGTTGMSFPQNQRSAGKHAALSWSLYALPWLILFVFLFPEELFWTMELVLILREPQMTKVYVGHYPCLKHKKNHATEKQVTMNANGWAEEERKHKGQGIWETVGGWKEPSPHFSLVRGKLSGRMPSTSGCGFPLGAGQWRWNSPAISPLPAAFLTDCSDSSAFSSLHGWPGASPWPDLLSEQVGRTSLFANITLWQLTTLHMWWGGWWFLAAFCISHSSPSDHCHHPHNPMPSWDTLRTLWNFSVSNLFPPDVLSSRELINED